MEYNRQDVTFKSGRETCRAWMYSSSGLKKAETPCIVMAHGIGLTKDAGIEPYAVKFANAGFIVLLFDYRHFGESEGQPRQLFSVDTQLEDWQSAINFARSLKGADPSKIGLWGTSFSGGHVIVAAAKDKRVAAVSSQGPMMDATAALLNYLGYAGFTDFMKLGMLGMLDQIKSLFGFKPIYIPLVAPPRNLAVMSTQDALPGYNALMPPGWRNEICARYALWVGTYRPVTYAKKVKCPVLIQVCTKDKIVPPQAAVKTAEKIGQKAILQQFNCEHFDIYKGDFFESASQEQLQFFKNNLM